MALRRGLGVGIGSPPVAVVDPALHRGTDTDGQSGTQSSPMKTCLRWLAVTVGALLVLVLLAAVVATRPAFITSVIVPQIGRSIQTEIRIGSLEFSPFSRLEAGKIQVGSDEAPLLRGDLLRVRYALWSLVTGRVRVDEVRLDGTTIHVLRRADGSTNLPVFPASDHDDDDDDDDDDEAEDVRITGIRLSGISLVYEQEAGPAQAPLRVRLSDLTLDVPELASAKEAVLKLSGRLEDLAVGGVAGVRGTLQGEGRLGLDPTLAVSLVDLVLRIRFDRGTANAIDLAGREIRLDVQATADPDGLSLRRVAVSELHGDSPEAVLAVSGRLRREPADIALDVSAEPIESAVFGIAGALAGDLAFGEPSGAYRGKIRMQSPLPLRRKLDRNLEQPWTVTASGRLDLRSLCPASKALGLKGIAPFDACLDHDLVWSSEDRRLEVKALSVRAGNAGREMLTAELSQPLVLDFSASQTSAGLPEAVLALKARGLALNAVNPFLPAGLPLQVAAGSLDADASVTVARQGASIQVASTMTVSKAALAGLSGETGVPFSLEAAVKATVADRRRIEAETVRIALESQAAKVALIQAPLRFDLDQGGSGTVSFDGLRETLLSILPPGTAAGMPLERFTVAGEVRWQAGKGFVPLTADAKVDVSEVRLRRQEGTAELSAALAAQADINAEALALRSATARVAVDGQTALQASVDGSVGLTRAPSAAHALSLRSELLDLDRLLAFAKPLLAKPVSAEAASPAPATTPVPSPAAVPASGPALPPLNAVLNVDLANVVYNGRQAALRGAARLTDAIELKSLQLALPSGSILIDAVARPQGQDWRLELRLAASGEALGELAAWTGKTVPAESVGGTSLALRLEGTAAPDGSRARLDVVEAKLSEAGKPPRLAVALMQPLALSRSADGSLRWTDTGLSVTATHFPVATVNPLLPARAGLRVDRGFLDAALTVALKSGGLQAEVNGTFDLTAFTGSRGPQRFEALDLEGSLQGWAQGRDRVTVSTLKGSLSSAGAKAVVFALTGNWDRAQGGSGNFDLTVDVPVALSVATSGATLRSRVNALTVNLAGKVQMPAGNSPVRAEVSVAAADIRLADSSGAALPPWGVRIASAAVVHPDHLDLETLSLRASTPEKDVASLALTGTLALPPMKGRNEVRLTGDLLDVTLLKAVTLGAETRKAEGAKSGNEPDEPAAEPGPLSTGQAVVLATLDLKNVIYGEARSDLACTIRLEDSVVTVDPLKSSLCGAAATGKARVNLAVPGFDYAVALSVAGLDPAPLVKTFAPTLAPSVQGTVTGLDLQLAGQGVTLPSLRQALNGRLDVGAKDVVLQGLPGQAELARKWAAPELERIQVSQVDLKTRVGDGKVLVETFRETAPEHTINASGSVGLDERLSLDIGFGVGGALLTRLQSEARVQNFLRYFTKQGDYTVSPVPITLKGTVRKPKFDGDRFLTELAKASAANLLQQAVQQPSGAALGTLLQGVIGQNGTPPGHGANGTSSGPAGQGTSTGRPGSQTQDATRTDGSSQGKPGALSLPEVLVPFVLGGAGSAGAAQGDGDRRPQTPRRLPGPNARPQD